MFYAIDIETNTEGFLPGTTTPKGLDPRGTEIASIAGYDGTNEFYACGSDERAILRELNEWLMDAPSGPGILTGWNDANFDYPFILTRSSLLEVPLGLVARVSPARKSWRNCAGHEGGYALSWGPHDHIDLMQPFKPFAKKAGERFKLKVMGRYFGMDPIEVDRENIHLLSPEELREYNLSDVRVNHRLAEIAQQVEKRRNEGVTLHKNGIALTDLSITPWLDSQV
jgi:uncharacterized protein YprB with RNaseH-like and TPR domain